MWPCGRGPQRCGAGSGEPAEVGDRPGQAGDGAGTQRAPPPAGDVFFATRQEQFTFLEARAFCESHNATLASTGQLYAAWSRGLDKCYAGWLADGSLRYPIVTPRPACGGDKPGVRTVYLYPNQTGLPDPLSRHHAFCFRGTSSDPPAPPCQQSPRAPAWPPAP
jgi:aggrecan 1